MKGANANTGRGQQADVCRIDSRLELFVDDWLIEHRAGVELRLQHPIPQEVSIVFDRPWEGNTSAYVTVFQDENLYRMYYRGSHFDWASGQSKHQVVCYAESVDGVEWYRPELGLHKWGGSAANNIIWMNGPGTHNFTPFRDNNPQCRPEARYKALGGDERGLLAFQSSNGLHWSLMQDRPVITEGAFDSQNLAFWDSVRGRYAEYHRGFRDGVRDIMTCTSKDFLHWTQPEWLDFGDAPREHLYTNTVIPYFRAPHLLLGCPMRFMEQRKKIEDHPYNGVSDGVLMTSRDGLHWHRWLEAFLRPGLQRERWWQRNNYAAWGLLPTRSSIAGAPDELSFYFNEHYYLDGNRLRRFTLRTDGFVSAHAEFAGGEFVTRPLVFEGCELAINYSTSAAGSVRVEIQDVEGQPIGGYSLDDCPEIYGDAIEEVVRWRTGGDVSGFSNRPVRLRFALSDADLYAIRFRR